MAPSRCYTVFIGNLSNRVSEKVLYELFFQAGPIHRVHIPKKNGVQQSFAFVTYNHSISTAYATCLLQGIRLHGKSLTVRPTVDSADASLANKSHLIEYEPEEEWKVIDGILDEYYKRHPERRNGGPFLFLDSPECQEMLGYGRPEVCPWDNRRVSTEDRSRERRDRSPNRRRPSSRERWRDRDRRDDYRDDPRDRSHSSKDLKSLDNSSSLRGFGGSSSFSERSMAPKPRSSNGFDRSDLSTPPFERYSGRKHSGDSRHRHRRGYNR